MTTQPSDWGIAPDDPLVTAWRNRFVSESTELHRLRDGIGYEMARLHAETRANEFETAMRAELWKREQAKNDARELDASGGGSEPVAWANPADINCLGFEDGNSYPGIRRHADELHTSPLYATPRAAEAGEWLPIESAPDDIGLCVVYTPDHGDGERYDFDWKEDGVWQEHYNHFEHFMAVGGANACGPDVVCTGPGEDPEYTHYRRLTPPQAAMGAVGAGGGE